MSSPSIPGTKTRWSSHFVDKSRFYLMIQIRTFDRNVSVLQYFNLPCAQAPWLWQYCVTVLRNLFWSALVLRLVTFVDSILITIRIGSEFWPINWAYCNGCWPYTGGPNAYTGYGGYTWWGIWLPIIWHFLMLYHYLLSLQEDYSRSSEFLP